ncbi:putative E3 ubiquitin-protein ligase MARCHF10 [Pelodytes ibericus]
MSGDWERQKLIVNRHHMRDMQNRIDLEYEAYLRYKEREREHTECSREYRAASHYTNHSLTNKYSTRNYHKPWQAGMTTEKLVSRPSAREKMNDREPRNSKNQSRLPAINRSGGSLRMKAASRLTAKPQTEKAAAVIQPRIMVQQKRLHTRQLQDNLSTADRGTTQGKSGKIPAWQSHTLNHHGLNCLAKVLFGKGKDFQSLYAFTPESGINLAQNIVSAIPLKLRDDLHLKNVKIQEKSRQQNVTLSIVSPHVKQKFTRWDSAKKQVLTPISISPQDYIPTHLHQLRERPQNIPCTPNSTISPLIFCNDCLNDKPEESADEHFENTEEMGNEPCIFKEATFVISEGSISNLETDGRSATAETDQISEENEDHESILSQTTTTSGNLSSSQSQIAELYLRDSEDGYSSGSDNESILFQDSDFISEDENLQNYQEATPASIRQKSNLISAAIFSRRSHESIAPRVLGQHHIGSPASSFNIIEVHDISSYNEVQMPLENNMRSIAQAVEPPLPLLTQNIGSQSRRTQNHEVLIDGETVSQEDREQSTASSRPSDVSSHRPFNFSTITSSPNIETLQENLNLIFDSLTMRRQPGNRDVGRVLPTEESKEVEIPKADPERLRKLQESLLQEDSEEEEDICRICLRGGDSAGNHLIVPCQCTGSLKYVHQECIKKWLLAKITSGADLDAVRTCEMCRQSVQSEIDGFDLNEHYRKHLETQGQRTLNPNLYLVLLLHLYQQRYEELLRLLYTQDQVKEISGNISYLRSDGREILCAEYPQPPDTVLCAEYPQPPDTVLCAEYLQPPDTVLCAEYLQPPDTVLCAKYLQPPDTVLCADYPQPPDKVLCAECLQPPDTVLCAEYLQPPDTVLCAEYLQPPDTVLCAKYLQPPDTVLCADYPQPPDKVLCAECLQPPDTVLCAEYLQPPDTVLCAEYLQPPDTVLCAECLQPPDTVLCAEYLQPPDTVLCAEYLQPPDTVLCAEYLQPPDTVLCAEYLQPPDTVLCADYPQPPDTVLCADYPQPPDKVLCAEYLQPPCDGLNIFNRYIKL